MEKFKCNLFVIVLVVFMLVCGFMLGRIDFDNDGDNQYLTEDGNVINITEDNVDEFMSTFIGKYNFEKVYEEPAGCEDYYNLELKSDGSYSYNYGSTCGSGYSAKGNYSISKDKIYLFNENCEYVVNDNECIEPNCSTLIVLEYELENGKVDVFSGTTELVKE